MKTPSTISNSNSFNKWDKRNYARQIATWALWATLLLTPACSSNNSEKSNNWKDSNIEIVEQEPGETLEQYIDSLNSRFSDLTAKIKADEANVQGIKDRQDSEWVADDEPLSDFFYSDEYYSNVQEVNEIKEWLGFYNGLKSHLWEPVRIISTNFAMGDALWVTSVNHIYYSEKEYNDWLKEITDMTNKNLQEWKRMMNDPNTTGYSIWWWEYEIKEIKKIEHLSSENIGEILKEEALSPNYSLGTQEIFWEIASKYDSSTYILTQDDYNRLMGEE